MKINNLRSQFLNGVKHAAFAQYSNIFVNIFISAVLARLLSPEDFGIVALVNVFLAFFALFSDFGFSSGIVQYKNLSEEQIITLFYISVFLGFILAIAFYFFSYFIARFYNSNVYVDIGMVLSINLIFNSASVIPYGILRREQRFKQIGVILVTVSIFTGIFGIILAAAGLGYWSLIYRVVLSSILIFILQCSIVKIQLKPRLKFAGLKSMINYSIYNFLFQFVNFFSRRLDNILIGKFLGASQLGFYDRAYNLMRMPLSNFTMIINNVMHPVLSNSQDNKNIIISIHIKICKFLSLLGVPLSIFLYFNSFEIITIFYGTQWEESVEPFKWLALSIWIQMLLSSTGGVLMASGNSKHYFIIGTLSAVVMISAICLGVYFGDLKILSQFLLIAFSINFLSGFFILYKYVLNIPFSTIFKNIKNEIIIGIITFLFLSFIPQFTINIWIKFVLELILIILVFTASYYFLGEFERIFELFPEMKNNKIIKWFIKNTNFKK